MGQDHDVKVMQAAILDLCSRVIALEKRLCMCDEHKNSLKQVEVMGSINENERVGIEQNRPAHNTKA